MKKLVQASLAVVSLASAVLVSASPADAGGSPGAGRSVTVMTRNLYLGADIQRPITATDGKEGVDALIALGHANHDVSEIVDRTRFGVRAGLIADEIVSTNPDLVGLQEVALWRSGPVELPPDGAVGALNASTVEYDFLKMLLDELAAKGESYTAVSVQTEADIEAPSFLGNPFDGTMTDASDQRLTMRDVILKRDASAVHVLDSGSGSFQARLELSVAGLPATFVRGYNWVDARVGGARFRFVNSHLEAFSSDLAMLQAQELLSGPAGRPGTTILVCDCNSDPLDSSVRPTDVLGTPNNGPYNAIVDAGYTDQWQHWSQRNGFTSGLSETVDDSRPGFSQRIDFVFAKGPAGGLSVARARTVGRWLADRDAATGLWPSDHAGVVMRLRLPQ